MPPIARRRKHPVLNIIRWVFLAIAVATLGYVSYSLTDAKVFQAYENWRLDRAVKNADRSAAVPSRIHPASATAVEEVARLPVRRGDVLGRLEISRIGMSVIIAEGVDGKTLRRAVGHVPGTAYPGEAGNVALSGHRDTYFRALKDIRQGDEVTLTTARRTYRYRVDSLKVVAETEIGVLQDSGGSVLTLVTCYPFYYVGPAPKRFIVRAHLEPVNRQF
ncbi:MAG: class D sortase [Terriglobales bacterium]